MFGISSTELMIIVIFGFLLFGPDKLPQMGRTLGRALRQFRETQEKMTSVVQSEVIDPMAAAAAAPVKPKKASAAAQASDDDLDADIAEGVSAEPRRKETFAERRARLAAEKAQKEQEAADAAAADGDAASEPAPEAEAAAPAAAEPEPAAEPEAEPEQIRTTEDLYARRPRKRCAADAEAPEADQAPDAAEEGSEN